MKQVITELKKWYEHFCNRRAVKKQALLDAEANKAVQVMEFNGRLFICVNGKPLFDIDIFKNSVAEVVAIGRKTYKDWEEEKLWAK